MREITTQAEFDTAYAAGEREFDISGMRGKISIAEGAPTLWVKGNSRVRVDVLGDSAPELTTCDESRVDLWVYGSSQPELATYDKSFAKVWVYDSSQPGMSAWDDSHLEVRMYESSRPSVMAYYSKRSVVYVMGDNQPRVNGDLTIIQKDYLVSETRGHNANGLFDLLRENSRIAKALRAYTGA